MQLMSHFHTLILNNGQGGIPYFRHTRLEYTWQAVYMFNALKNLVMITVTLNLIMQHNKRNMIKLNLYIRVTILPNQQYFYNHADLPSNL